MAKKPLSDGGAYFGPQREAEFFGSGCTLLDCVLGGGYSLGHIVNIVGDKSTGKTLLAIEASANFAQKYDGPITYNESEAAFDERYAALLGLPTKRLRLVRNCSTVEDVFEDMQRVIDKQPKGKPGLYILDSLDALSDRAELKRNLDEGSYGMEKPKLMSRLFRQLVQQLASCRITVIIVSQVRSAIGVKFGRKTTRSGGRALDFYASQIIYLAQKGALSRTARGQKRATGIVIKVKCDKSKVGLPFRDCEFPILFGFGIDDVAASLDWLGEVKGFAEAGLTAKSASALYEGLDKMDAATYAEWRNKLGSVVRSVWWDLEKEFMPKRLKYGEV